MTLPTTGAGHTRIEEIRQRCEAATEAPWLVEELDGYITGHVIAEAHDYCGHSGRDARRDSVTHHESMTQVDAAFIASAREDIPWLLTAHDALVAALRGVMRDDGHYLECPAPDEAIHVTMPDSRN